MKQPGNNSKDRTSQKMCQIKKKGNLSLIARNEIRESVSNHARQ
jgi:hypothetical protein